jgi:DNA invertase Pin-like site-specific DNA recombinase
MSDKRNEQRRDSKQKSRIVLYVRRSTDRQDQASILSQFECCRRQLKALGIDHDAVVIQEISEVQEAGPR